jgi:hypothetical protein
MRAGQEIRQATPGADSFLPETARIAGIDASTIVSLDMSSLVIPRLMSRQTDCRSVGPRWVKHMSIAPEVDKVIAAAKVEGLIPKTDKDAKVSGRVHRVLLDAATKRAGLSSETALPEYALAKVALEDDFGDLFSRLRGPVGADVGLEF